MGFYSRWRRKGNYPPATSVIFVLSVSGLLVAMNIVVAIAASNLSAKGY
jgi:hypothetical protein